MKNSDNSLLCTECHACLPLEKFLRRKVNNKITFICPVCKSHKVVPARVFLRKNLSFIQSIITVTLNLWQKISDILNTCDYGLNLIKALDENAIYVPEKIVNELISIEAKVDSIINVLFKILKTCEIKIDRSLKLSRELVDFIENLVEISEDLQKISYIFPYVKNIAEKVQKIMNFLKEREKLMHFKIKVPNATIEKIFKAIKVGTTTLVFTNLSLIVITKKKTLRLPISKIEVRRCILSKVIISAGETKIKIKVKDPQQVIEKIVKIKETAQTIVVKNIENLLEERHLIRTHNLKEVKFTLKRISEKIHHLVDLIERILNKEKIKKEDTSKKISPKMQTIFTQICS